MKHRGQMLVCLAGSLALCATAPGRTADQAGNPYQAIVERNVFGLKPPPPPPDPEANKPPLPKLTLTGIVTLGGAKRALLKTPPPAPKPGETAKTEQGFILCVGERQGDIEVLEIDEKAGSVKVNYGGTVTDLTFEKDGVKAPPTPGAPGSLPSPGFVPPMKAVMATPGGIGQVPPAFARSIRTPGKDGSVSPQAAEGAGPPAVTANPTATTQPTAPQASAEQSYLMLEANRLRHQKDIQAGRYPPLPRHPMAASLQDQTPAPAPAPAPAGPPLPPGGAQQYPQ